MNDNDNMDEAVAIYEKCKDHAINIGDLLNEYAEKHNLRDIDMYVVIKMLKAYIEDENPSIGMANKLAKKIYKDDVQDLIKGAIDRAKKSDTKVSEKVKTELQKMIDSL